MSKPHEPPPRDVNPARDVAARVGASVTMGPRDPALHAYSIAHKHKGVSKMTAKARVKVRKEVRVRASRRSDHQLDTEVLANHEKRTSFDLDYLDELASTIAVAHNAVLRVREAILRVSDDLAYVPHGTRADPDPQYRKKLLENFHIIQSFWFICDDIKSVVAPPLEREVRRLAPNAFKEEYAPLTPSEKARRGLERLKRWPSSK